MRKGAENMTKKQDCGRFICELRKERRWTQSQLAERLQVTDKAVSRWETGKGYPDVEILLTLAEVMEVSVSELLLGQRISDGKKADEAETAALLKLKKECDRMTAGACAVLLTGFASLFLGFNLWIAFGYLSDAFRGFRSVMDEAHFGSFSQMLLLLLPAAVIALCVWMLYDNPKNQPENDSKEIPASGREKRAEPGGKE